LAESLRPMNNIIRVFIFLTDAAVKYAGAFIPVKFFQASQIFASKATSYSLHDVQLSCLTRKYLTSQKKLGRDKRSRVFHVSVCYGDWTGTKSGYPDSRTASLNPNPITLFKGAATEKKYKDQ
jgi:hypothetical protein